MNDRTPSRRSNWSRQLPQICRRAGRGVIAIQVDHHIGHPIVHAPHPHPVLARRVEDRLQAIEFAEGRAEPQASAGRIQTVAPAGAVQPASFAAIRSATMMVVTLVATDGISGMIEASTTRRSSRPRTLPQASTTALGSVAPPIGTVEVGCR